jgi:hypothetical protein
MRFVLVSLALAVLLAPAAALDDKETKAVPRYGVNPDLETYPQATPKETLASVLKAVEKKRIDYVLAQLADPDWVDMRVKETGGSFEDVVKDSTGKLAADPRTLKELNRFLKEGEWEASDAAAACKLKDIKDRQVFMRKTDGRWFLEHRQKPAAEGK